MCLFWKINISSTTAWSYNRGTLTLKIVSTYMMAMFSDSSLVHHYTVRSNSSSNLHSHGDRIVYHKILLCRVSLG